MNRRQSKLLKEGFRDLRRACPIWTAPTVASAMRWARHGLIALLTVSAIGGIAILRSMGVSPMTGNNGHGPDVHGMGSEVTTAKAQPSSRPALTPPTARAGAEARPDAPPRVERR